MKAGGMRGVEFLIVDSDLQALLGSDVENQIQIGETLTGGLGAGMDPELGRRAAEEARDRLLESLHGADLVFVVAGLGGGTGSGAAPVVAACAQQTGALTVGVVAKPSLFEGKRRSEQADSGIFKLRDHVDALVVFPKDHLLQEIKGKPHTLSDFRTALAEVLPRGVCGITDLITVPGLLNVTVADVKKVLAGAGIVSPGLGTARGDNASVTAAKWAVTKAGPGAARSVILNVTGGKDLSLYDATRAADIVAGAVEPEAGVLFGVVIDETLEPDEVRVSCYFIQGTAG
jgi:cell division protein FtsZ